MRKSEIVKRIAADALVTSLAAETAIDILLTNSPGPWHAENRSRSADSARSPRLSGRHAWADTREPENPLTFPPPDPFRSSRPEYSRMP